jgi:hypothetical protein
VGSRSGEEMPFGCWLYLFYFRIRASELLPPLLSYTQLKTTTVFINQSCRRGTQDDNNNNNNNNNKY